MPSSLPTSPTSSEPPWIRFAKCADKSPEKIRHLPLLPAKRLNTYSERSKMKAFFQASKGSWFCKYRKKKVFLCRGKRTKADKARAAKIMKAKCPPLLDVRLGQYNRLKEYASFFLEHVQANYAPTSFVRIRRRVEAF